MRVIDRYIIRRFLTNCFMLLMVLYVFATSIDLLLNLDKFVEVARSIEGEEASRFTIFITLVQLVVDFQGPRLFQFYGYMHGLIAVGAMAFTLAQMYRHKELVAVMAAGVSLHRVAMPFVVGTFLLSFIQLINQEFMLPRVAPLLLRDHGQIGQNALESFPIELTPDSDGNLLHAPVFIPSVNGGELRRATILYRDENGRTIRSINAARAEWDAERSCWNLRDGQAINRIIGNTDSGTGVSEIQTERVLTWDTDLTPETLTVRRHGQFAQMLSLAQIQRILASTDVVDTQALVRYKYARFSTALVNLLVLALTLPTFLIRAPATLSRQALKCAAIAVPALIGAAIGMLVEIPGFSPAVGVFFPVLILIPLVMARWTWFET